MTDAASEDHPHIPGSGIRGRIDTWRDWSRRKRVSVNRVMARVLRVYSSIWHVHPRRTLEHGAEAIKAIFAIVGVAISFGRKAPV